MSNVVRRVDAQNRIDHQRAVEVLKMQGLAFNVPVPEERQRWMGMADKASQEMTTQGALSADLVKKLNGMLVEYRETLD
jgi:hypothetical protein